ncbi:MAG TPA: PaaI family thioesterase [Terracidiphilus sp.]|nr:PaaI family thioesterase [Terracidiphilus sp.]
MNQASSENLKPFVHAAQNRCFGCGQANETGLHLEFQLTPEDAVVCQATVGDSYEGPPGYLHGGIIATLLDESMSKAVRARGLVAMTRHMAVDYMRPVRSGSAIRMEGRMVRSEGRKHWAQAEVRDDDGRVLAKAEGLFVEASPEQREALAKRTQGAKR